MYLHWNRYWQQTPINGDIKRQHTPSWIKEYKCKHNMKLMNKVLTLRIENIEFLSYRVIHNRVWHSWNFCEYTNIFVSKKLHKQMSENISMKDLTRTIQIFVWFLHSNTLRNECPNIFVQMNLTRTNVQIYS